MNVTFILIMLILISLHFKLLLFFFLHNFYILFIYVSSNMVGGYAVVLVIVLKVNVSKFSDWETQRRPRNTTNCQEP